MKTSIITALFVLVCCAACQQPIVEPIRPAATAALRPDSLSAIQPAEDALVGDQLQNVRDSRLPNDPMPPVATVGAPTPGQSNAPVPAVMPVRIDTVMAQ